MLNYDKKDLELVCLIAQNESLKYAADRLFMTIPAASIRLKRLEELFHVTLFERKSRRLILTEAGTKFYDIARAILLQAQVLESRMQDYSHQKANTVRLYTNYSGLMGGVQNDIGDFLKRFPDVNVDFTLMHTPSVIQALIDGIADIGIVSNIEQPEGLKCISYFEDSYVLLMNKNNPKAKTFPNPISIAELKDFPLVALNKEVIVQEFFERCAQEAGCKINIRARFPSLHAGLETMRKIQGGMLALKSFRIAQRDDIEVFELKETWKTQRVSICLPQDETKISVNTQNLVKYLLAPNRWKN